MVNLLLHFWFDSHCQWQHKCWNVHIYSVMRDLYKVYVVCVDIYYSITLTVDIVFIQMLALLDSLSSNKFASILCSPSYSLKHLSFGGCFVWFDFNCPVLIQLYDIDCLFLFFFIYLIDDCHTFWKGAMLPILNWFRMLYISGRKGQARWCAVRLE